MQKIQVGNNVEWMWGRGKGEGKATRKFTSDVERTIKGKKIRRKADGSEPAFLVEQDSGGRVLKSQSELEKSHD